MLYKIVKTDFLGKIVLSLFCLAPVHLDAMELAKLQTAKTRQQERRPLMIDAWDLVKVMGRDTVVTYATKADNAPLLKALLENVDVNSFKLEDFEIGLLHVAAKSNSPAAAQTLIDLGITINWRSHTRHETPLVMAVEYGCPAVLKVLLQNNADTNLQKQALHGEYRHVLSLAVENYGYHGERKFLEIIMILLDSGKVADNKVSQERARIESLLKAEIEKGSEGKMIEKYRELLSLLQEHALGLKDFFENPSVNNRLSLLPLELRIKIRNYFRLSFLDAPAVLPAPVALPK